MALTGYPQDHYSPEIVVLQSGDQNDTTQYLGPFSSIKCLSDATTEAVTLYIYLTKEGYDEPNGTQVAGTHYYEVAAVATDTIGGPIYGFRYHTDSSTGSSVMAYRYSSDIL